MQNKEEILSIYRPVDDVLKTSLSVRKVLGSIPEPVKSDTE